MSQPPVYKPEEDPVYLLFKRAMETAGAKQKEGHSIRLRVEKGGSVIDFETNPPPIISGGKSGSGWAQQRKANKQETENALRGFEEFVTIEETADKILVKRKKYLGEEFKQIGEALKPLGFKWSQEVSGWEVQKK